MPKHLFGLDLLRATAIGLVLLSHYGDMFASWYGLTTPVAWSICSTYGVQLFFVLSGYLIGGILLNLPEGGAALRVFLVRRWMRTLPLYFLVLMGLFLLFPPASRALWHLLHYGSFTQNFATTLAPDAWFGWSWSLSAEEWFYLIFAAVLAVFGRVVGHVRALVGFACFCLVVPSLVRAIAVLDFGQMLPDKIALLQFDALACGVVAACLLRGIVLPWGFGLALAGIGVCCAVSAWLFAGLTFAPPWWMPVWLIRTTQWGQPILASVGFALCLPAASCWRAAPWFVAGPVGWLSTRSYAIYLTHLIVLVAVAVWFLRAFPASVFAACIVTVVVAVCVAELLHVLVERPVMARRPRQPEPFLVAHGVEAVGS